MPYIVEDKRRVLQQSIDSLVNDLRQLECDDSNNSMAGNINYVFTTVLARVYSPVNYDNVNEVSGILSCVDKEFYRRLAAPYEDQKSFDNGDVFPSDIG